MYKFLFFLNFCLFALISCRKKSDIHCRLDGEKTICECDEKGQVVILKNKTIRVVKKYVKGGSIIWGFDRSGNLISKTYLFKRKKNYHYIEYKNGGIVKAAQFKHDLFERISFFVRHGNRYYTVKYALPKLKTAIPVYYFAKNNKGEIFGDYYYYNLTNENTIEFRISDKNFNSQTQGLDSMFIDFARVNFKSVPFVRVPSYDIYPNLADFKSERVVMNEKIHFSKKESLYITGLFWSFVKRPGGYINYRDVIVCGDLMERVRIFDLIVDQNKLGSNSIFQELNLDYLKIRENKTLIQSADLKEKIKDIH
jgi:hypothetical protein